MPYSQFPPNIAYPNVQADAWVVISRLSEVPVRVVPSLKLVNLASEFALPLPTGQVPTKQGTISFSHQMVDDLGRPLYDDGSPTGTAFDKDVDNNTYPPKMETISEVRDISLRDYPGQFSLEEVFQFVIKDFLKKFPFYNYGYISIFDDRYDAISVYQGQQQISGFASGGHPIFAGPIQFKFDSSSNPRGHLLLIAPDIPGINWLFQIRHGVVEANGKKGPIIDLEQASRKGEVFYLYPMENVPITPTMLTDASNTEVTHGWIRTSANGQVMLEKPIPIVPFIIILGRSSGATIIPASA